jgi:bacteriorhodopsin
MSLLCILFLSLKMGVTVENKHEDMSHGNCVQGTQSTPLIIAAIAVTADPHLWNIVAQVVAAAV